MGPNKSYKYDLTDLLVPLTVLSFDHQNHSKWPKWSYVRYIGALDNGRDEEAAAR
jgi:hypothetical protein